MPYGPAARVGDLTSHGSPLAPGPGSTNVLIGSMPAWRALMDFHACPIVKGLVPDVGGMVMMGSPMVLINSMMACRVMDMVVEIPGGPNPIAMGATNVLIGDVGVAPPSAPAAAMVRNAGLGLPITQPTSKSPSPPPTGALMSQFSRLGATTAESVERKLSGYLLNPTHPEGGSKAKWFQQALGFNKDNSADLAKQIVFDHKTAIQTGVTEFGTKYNQIIRIVGANGKTIDVTFAWIRNTDGVVRLVTAIPT